MYVKFGQLDEIVVEIKVGNSVYQLCMLVMGIVFDF